MSNFARNFSLKKEITLFSQKKTSMNRSLTLMTSRSMVLPALSPKSHLQCCHIDPMSHVWVRVVSYIRMYSSSNPSIESIPLAIPTSWCLVVLDNEIEVIYGTLFTLDKIRPPKSKIPNKGSIRLVGLYI